MSKYCTCGNEIPSRITVGGKLYRGFKNRKFCFQCHPFKSKNGTGSLYSKWSEERKARHRAVSSKKGLQRKSELVQMAGGKCIICSYDKCIRALQFHHRDPKDKLFELNACVIKSKPWDQILIEFKKCDLLCVRCHVEIESKQYEHYIDVELIEQSSSIQKEQSSSIQKEFPCSKCGHVRNYKTASICEDCSRKRSRKVERPDYHTLQKQIETLGFLAVGRLYGVSDNSIRKWVKQYQKAN